MTTQPQPTDPGRLSHNYPTATPQRGERAACGRLARSTDVGLSRCPACVKALAHAEALVINSQRDSAALVARLDAERADRAKAAVIERNRAALARLAGRVTR